MERWITDNKSRCFKVIALLSDQIIHDYKVLQTSIHGYMGPFRINSVVAAAKFNSVSFSPYTSSASRHLTLSPMVISYTHLGKVVQASFL